MKMNKAVETIADKNIDTGKRDVTKMLGGVGVFGMFSPSSINQLAGSFKAESQMEEETLVFDAITEIEEIWGFEFDRTGFDSEGNSFMINSNDGLEGYDVLRNLTTVELRRMMEVFPPGFGEMILANSRRDFFPEKGADALTLGELPNGKLRISVDSTNNGRSLAQASEGKITIVPRWLPGDKAFMFKDVVHEMAHLVHYSYQTNRTSARMEDFVGHSDYLSVDRVKPGFLTFYQAADTYEHFAEIATELFVDTQKCILILRSGGEKSLQISTVIEMYSQLTAGLMDTQYFYDLANGRVNLEYWKTKNPSESYWVGDVNSAVYITDLDKGSKETVPVMVLAKTDVLPSSESIEVGGLKFVLKSRDYLD